MTTDTMTSSNSSTGSVAEVPAETPTPVFDASVPPKEVGGRGGLEPTRYGDWEKNGRCIDF
ncbi:MAG TPA: DUF1674 domain-containing protein [Rudaea sp.]|nr:DUF1674 domain-containing protein [Rudaea sp.]